MLRAWRKSVTPGAIRLIQRALRPLRLRASVRIAGRRFYFDPATDIGLLLLTKRRFEQAAIEQCAKFIRDDSAVIDVGANIGLHTVHYADMARLGKVVSFEPSRSTFAYLLKNVGRLSNVVPLNVALSDTAGLTTFFVADDDAYSGLKDTGRKAIVNKETVACFVGDQILRPLVEDMRVDLIKIDVEGLEQQVLKGMKDLILAHRPVIFCEIFGGSQSNPDPQGTVRFCVSLGYDAFVLDETGLVPTDSHSDTLYNYFFLPKR